MYVCHALVQLWLIYKVLRVTSFLNGTYLILFHTIRPHVTKGSYLKAVIVAVDPDLELRRGREGGGFVLLALPTFLPSANSSFYTK